MEIPVPTPAPLLAIRAAPAKAATRTLLPAKPLLPPVKPLPAGMRLARTVKARALATVTAKVPVAMVAMVAMAAVEMAVEVTAEAVAMVATRKAA